MFNKFGDLAHPDPDPDSHPSTRPVLGAPSALTGLPVRGVRSARTSLPVRGALSVLALPSVPAVRSAVNALAALTAWRDSDVNDETINIQRLK